MLEEVSLDDGELQPMVSPIRSERLPNPIIITNGNWDQQQTIVTRIIVQGRTYCHNSHRIVNW